MGHDKQDIIKVAIVQAGTVLYNNIDALKKLRIYANEAAKQSAKLVLFPEAFIGGYPKGLNFGVRLGMRSSDGREEFRRYWETAIEEDGPESQELAQIASEFKLYLVTGVVERSASTLYCSVFFYSPEGKFLGKHRKLMPTALERVVWGLGDASTIPVIETDVGRIGAVICWENYMPLLRVAMYTKGIQLYLAPTVDDRDVWLSTMRTIAIEGRCFVLSACQYLTASAFPEGHPARNSDEVLAGGNTVRSDDPVLIRGGSCAVDPFGNVILQPDFSGEKIAFVDCDLREIPRGKFDLDTVGHYARPDIFKLVVNEDRLTTTSE
uniref:CN hydrolase domain-containing protein n=1 Tax=Ascaris lumbricoides TaxID=6252 RepID=A0A0M3I4D7_ASCLU